MFVLWQTAERSKIFPLRKQRFSDRFGCHRMVKKYGHNGCKKAYSYGGCSEN